MKIKKGYTLEKLPGLTLVLGGEKGDTYLKLNDTAAFVWEGIEKGLTEEEIASELKKIYAVSANDESKAKQIETDVRGLLSAWIEGGYVEA